MEKHEVEKLLLDVLPAHYSWAKKIDSIETMPHTGLFVFHDEKGCTSDLF